MADKEGCAYGIYLDGSQAGIIAKMASEMKPLTPLEPMEIVFKPLKQ